LEHIQPITNDKHISPDDLSTYRDLYLLLKKSIFGFRLFLESINRAYERREFR